MTDETEVQAKKRRTKTMVAGLIATGVIFVLYSAISNAGYLPHRREAFRTFDSLEEMTSQLSKRMSEQQKNSATWKYCKNDGSVGDGRDFLTAWYSGLSHNNYLVRKTPVGWREQGTRVYDEPRGDWDCEMIVPSKAS